MILKNGGGKLCEVKIYSPIILREQKYDVVIITSAPGLETIKQQCIDLGVVEEKIITSYVEAPLESRRIFLESLAKVFSNVENKYACAEAGVFEGDFAKYINMYFKGKKVYLFDTFEGFDERDIEKESGFSMANCGDYNNTSVELVMKKMPYPENVVICKGYFPESARKIKEEFCFVNLDMDLYEPTYNGLLFFEDKMMKGGIILVHDYFAENFKGPKEAVDRYLSEKPCARILPIGDGVSIMIVFSDKCGGNFEGT